MASRPPQAPPAPAAFRRAFFVFLGAALALRAGPPGAPSPGKLAQVGLPSQAEAEAIVARFRGAGFAGAGSCCLTFDLRELPRRGPERVFHGVLWAGATPAGSALRIELGDKGADGKYLLRGGPDARAWKWQGGGAVPVDLLAPLVPGSDLAAFDLLMPFLYWPGLTVVDVDRVLGRPANGFLFRPPAGFAAAHPEVAAVRAYLDAQYAAPVQVEVFGPDGQARKTLSLVDLKKVGERWIVKDADTRDEATRDKTRFSLTGAALGLDLSAALFEPAQLGESPSVPAGLERFAP